MDSTIHQTRRKVTNCRAKGRMLLYIVHVPIAINNLKMLNRCNNILTTTIPIVTTVEEKALEDVVRIHQSHVDVKTMMTIFGRTLTSPPLNPLTRLAILSQKKVRALLGCATTTNTPDHYGPITTQEPSTEC